MKGMIGQKSLGIKKINKRRLEIEYVNIEDLEPNSYNPNMHDIDSFNKLLKSIAVFGFTQPIVVHKDTMQIIDGEHRWRAASIIGYKEVPVCFLYLDGGDMRLATLIHNEATGEHSQDEIDRLAEALKGKNYDLKKELLGDL